MNDRMNVDDAVIVALGSNQALGAAGPQEVLEAALARFPAFSLEVVKRSEWWRSKAWPDAAGPEFVNGVAWIRTELGPQKALEALLAIEAEFGRERSLANAPRTLDLDLIAYGRITTPLPRGERGRGEGDGEVAPSRAGEAAPPLTPDAEAISRTPPSQPFPPRGGRALTLPHPRAHERLFVMGPFAEIAPDWRHPVDGRTAVELALSAAIGRDARAIV